MPSPAPLSLAFIVVSFNTRDATLACVRSIRTALALAAEPAREPPEKPLAGPIVVVDNASTDGTADALRAEFADVTVLALRDNLGFGAAVNLAANGLDTDLLMVLNADTRVPANVVSWARAAFANTDDLGILGPRLAFPDGRLQPSVGSFGDACGGLLHDWRERRRQIRRRRGDAKIAAFDAAHHAIARDVDWVTGAAFVVRRACFAALGGFAPEFFLYFEDVDLCRRARQHHWRVRFDPAVTVIHALGLSQPAGPLLAHYRHSRWLYARRHQGVLARLIHRLRRRT